jgi:hypothetical protein
MTETILDKTFHFIMEQLVKTGRAPFHPDLAHEWGSRTGGPLQDHCST